MTEALQTSCLPLQWHHSCRNAHGCSRVVDKQGTEPGCTALHSWLRLPRFYQLHVMIEQSPNVFRAPALGKKPSSIITHEDTDLRVGFSRPIAVGKHCQRCARSVLYLRCVSERAKPSLDVSTSAKCSWKSRDASLKTVQSPSETPNCVIAFGETLRLLYRHRIALNHGRIREKNTHITEENGKVFSTEPLLTKLL